MTDQRTTPGAWEALKVWEDTDARIERHYRNTWVCTNCGNRHGFEVSVCPEHLNKGAAFDVWLADADPEKRMDVYEAARAYARHILNEDRQPQSRD